MPSLILTLLLACTTPKPAPAQDLAWLVGTWSTTEGDLTTTERWAPLPDGSLLGSGTLGGDRMFVYAEALAIVDGPQGRALVAWPLKQAPTTFPVSGSAENEVRFENPAHDFPKTIVYRRTSQDELDVTATGVEQGAPREEQWKLTRMP